MQLNPIYLVVYVALGVLVLHRVVYRQLRGTVLTRKSLVIMPLVLTAAGVFSAADALGAATSGELTLLAVDVVVLAALGLLRSATTTLTARDSTTFQKGSVGTLLLWLATIGARVGFGFAAAAFGVSGALTSGSILLTLGISIGAQNALTYYRIQQRGLPLAEGSRRTLAQR
ncbi:hypothetical protein [Amycolatopsis jiangsuensis]|uniref:DUF1453 domain-containing protein n=1 Tax=Amycolatopsis jiangsuensis TaxID=1181879 RepID=A0A840J124_9PSEU|nr:hypothetical protein [Amycolatopsis jiangsuensis]MBB4687633.1 hypothetical protein [Amycolatopsis jiangsuensis]